MTIVQPNRNDLSAMSVFTFVMMVFLVLAAFGGMYLYNQLVSLRHDISAAKDNLNKAEVANADLKNSLYQTINIKNPDSFAQSQSLVQDKNPDYLQNAPQLSSN